MTRATIRLAEAEARGDAQAMSYWRAVIAAADAAPPLSEEQQAVIRVLLSRGGVSA